MHAGVPLLVSNVGCSGDERMIFCEGDAVEFIVTLRQLLDASNTEGLSMSVTKRAKELVLEKSAGEYMDLYRSLL